MSAKLEIRNSERQLCEGPYFTGEDVSRIARAVRLDLRIAAEEAAYTLNTGTELFLIRFVLERKNPTSPAEIKRWARDVEKTARQLFDVLNRVDLPWLHVTTRRDMPTEAQAAAAQLLGEMPTLTSAYGVAWLRIVGQRLLLEYGSKRGRRSHNTIGLAAFVLYAEGAFRELFREDPRVATVTELVDRDNADGGRHRFKARGGPFVRFMEATARHLAARIERDDHQIAAALRTWTKGDTLADKSIALGTKSVMENFAKKGR